MLTDDPSRLKSAPQLEALFESVGAAAGKTVVTTCGSGISACLLALALHELGRSPVAVYDGSWAEWGCSRGLSGGGGMRSAALSVILPRLENHA